MYYECRRHYNPILNVKAAFNFIESFIYDINVNLSNTVSSLHINICNVDVEKSTN
ncbi:hypothetical protein ALC57_14504 [Trachymyrmex cornetzi]|uniref:Uncharacterized protein n=1 Tax=Trachymyrmex cornetzi TaxID=471704 RepID=A0A151IYA8_9HYME|nr:hypothetical protein ALC57_14504 [Trachymyrmex cornetzi]